MKRLGLIGDVHAEDERLATALDLLARERVDAVLCVGDLSDGRGDLDRCIALLRAHGVRTVAGNHDRWLLADTMRHHIMDAQRLAQLSPSSVEFLRALPATLRLETAEGPLHLCHGLGRDDMCVVSDGRALEFELTQTGYPMKEALRRLDIDADTRFLVGGHTHQRCAERTGAITLLNPGTLRRQNEPGFALLDLATSTVQFYDLVEPTEARPAAQVAL